MSCFLQPVMITNRCADIDAEVVSAMGVPKAILNYVIFCHQEESSWPLEEGKKLKERFDQIFDTAHYNKALESMRKQAKLLEAEAKLVAERKKTNEYVLKEARQKQSKLNEHMANKEALDQKLSEIEDKLKPLREKLKKIEEIEQNFRQLTSKKGNNQLLFLKNDNNLFVIHSFLMLLQRRNWLNCRR